jgi:hypothetical protein
MAPWLEWRVRMNPMDQYIQLREKGINHYDKSRSAPLKDFGKKEDTTEDDEEIQERQSGGVPFVFTLRRTTARG